MQDAKRRPCLYGTYQMAGQEQYHAAMNRMPMCSGHDYIPVCAGIASGKTLKGSSTSTPTQKEQARRRPSKSSRNC